MSSTLPPQQVSTTLPRVAREMLMRAAAMNPHIPPGDSLERTRALEDAIQRVKLTYPTYFKEQTT